MIIQLSIDGSVQDVVQNLKRVIADADRHISVQCRALMALRCLSSNYLDIATAEHWNALLNKLNGMAESDKDVLYLEDALIVLLFLVCIPFYNVYLCFFFTLKKFRVLSLMSCATR